MHATVSRELSALSRSFSPSVIRDLGHQGRSPLLARLLAESRIPTTMPTDATLADAFEAGFKALRKIGSRDDYVYRSAIVQKIALGRHNLNSATVLSELRAGSSKADLVIVNGTTTAYEIKSERDSLQRLPQQLADYRRVFGTVNVVTSPGQVEAVRRIAPLDVGILTLTPRFHLRTVRSAIDSPERTCPLDILSTLRVDEAILVLEALCIEFTEVPNMERWSALRSIYATLDPAQTHAKVVTVLRSSRSQRHIRHDLARLPMSLRAGVLAANLDGKARANLNSATWQPLTSVLSWS